ncbi:ABC transporter permease [Rhizobium sp. ICMP 5592]|uniref:ABC transporter permease n=1 Tax=Rhizobium sp. ICMP 5592 TaxID=2292445 RepID=UPI001AEEDEEA|nr:ABC transporter permease [Rhizobium sp. ICMP 5592]
MMADMLGLANGIWSYRYFIANSIWNDFYTRFVRSKLGGAWIVLQPLSQVMIYALILSNLLSSKIPDINNTYGYAIYLMSGTLAWNLFSEIIDRCLKVFVNNANIIKKMNFPKVTLPAIAVGSAIVNNLILLVVMVVIFLFLGHVPSWNLMFIFLLIPVIVVFAVGIGLFLGIVNVFIRDVEQVVPIVLQILFWFTPIVYPITVIPEKYVRILKLNPMFDIVDAYHKAIAYDVVPRLTAVPVTLVLGLILCGISLVVFRRANTEMADVL